MASGEVPVGSSRLMRKSHASFDETSDFLRKRNVTSASSTTHVRLGVRMTLTPLYVHFGTSWWKY